ncbi:exosome complex protein Rrp42 [Candidatus Pacearchaeota archaeon]|nr:exosome complex protein Rrp42 [Candidatus Pacearchaeota archaeon]
MSNLTKKRVHDYLLEGKREGRGLLDYREIEIELGVSKNAEGSARVKVGKTEVVAGVKLDVTEPYTDHEDEGTLITTLELLPLSSPRFEAGPPKIEAIEIARIVDREVRESKFIDFKKLCIKKGEKVWGIFLDIFSINDDGNLLDAAGIAAVAALRNAKMPKYDEKEDKVEYGELTNKGMPLNKETPIILTFHKIGNKIFIDPGQEEEKASEGRISFGFLDGNINACQKGNDAPLKLEELSEILETAEKKAEEMTEKIDKAIEKALKARENRK